MDLPNSTKILCNSSHSTCCYTNNIMAGDKRIRQLITLGFVTVYLYIK